MQRLFILRILRENFSKLSLATLIYNLAVIVWGAYVRASGSGAGCGSHWPLCNGDVLPQAPRLQTLIEFSHRASSGVSLILIVILGVLAFSAFPRGNRVRKAAGASVIFIFLEALIGAGLVLYQLVEHDQSRARAVSISLHLVNTLFLLGALTLTYLWSQNPNLARPERKITLLLKQSVFAISACFILGVTGAITALGDTLFPSASLSEGIKRDFVSGSHFLVQLRVLHPLFAIGLATYLIYFAMKFSGDSRTARIFSGIVATQLLLGFFNLILMAPVALQLGHLLTANLLWIFLIKLIAEKADGEWISPSPVADFIAQTT